MTILFRDVAALAALGLFAVMISLWSDLIVYIV